MKLSELDDLCKEINIPYAYGKFTEPINPPHLIGTVIDTDNFGADNKVWYKNCNFRLELTTIKKDLVLESKVENELLKDIYWDKTENQIEDEGVYNISYFFNIEEE